MGLCYFFLCYQRIISIPIVVVPRFGDLRQAFQHLKEICRRIWKYEEAGEIYMEQFISGAKYEIIEFNS